MRVVVVGLGVQGHKRCYFAGDDFVATVDPFNEKAEYRSIEAVPLDAYDAVMLCVPDSAKLELITYLLNQGKHILVEKPFFVSTNHDLERVEALARSKGLVCYTAYNHRFEPNFIRMKNLIQSGKLGQIYHCRLFYGNGTARLVRDSAWRDKGAGVLPDLGSHLLDTINFWFDIKPEQFSVVSSHCFENQSPDHVLLVNHKTKPQFELEMTLLSWKNHFTCDIFAENGSAHINSLCKWGPSSFIHRIRQLPSGMPKEETNTLVQTDPTWALEYAHFKELCRHRHPTDLSTDRWLNQTLQQLSQSALSQVNQ
jgi:scyllo-inositol 2-dehydrogenase (NADP+)